MMLITPPISVFEGRQCSERTVATVRSEASGMEDSFDSPSPCLTGTANAYSVSKSVVVKSEGDVR